MPSSSNTQERRRHFSVRRRILNVLYDRFREVPYAFVELEAIEETCASSHRELNWNLVYLEKSGLVELNKTSESHPYVASGAALTARGIDLVEHPAELERRFPKKPDN